MPEKKIILSADGSCDLGEELKERYSVQYANGSVTVNDRRFTDGVDIKPDDMYRIYKETGVLPKTSAINAAEYLEHFKKFTDAGYEVIHICLSSGITSGYQTCLIAASELEGVYVVDSKSLSSGFGLLVAEAGDMIEQGMPAKDIVDKLNDMRSHIRCSFVLETLEFMRAGGRCSDITAFAATLLNLKPCIEMNNETGTMYVSKKYRGDMDKVLLKYTEDRFEKYDNVNPKRVYITHSGVPDERIALVRDYIERTGKFESIYVSRASCTISTHCGPGTLGVLFLTK